MKQIFDNSFDAMLAYYQVGLLVGAALCLGLGGLLLGHWLYYRWRGEKVAGCIIGIKQRGAYYHPVYRYTLASGKSYEAGSDTGSNDPSGMQTGKIVPLRVMPDQPESVHEARNYFLNAVGLFLVVTGIVLAYHALSSFPVTKWTWGALALFGAFGIRKFWRTIIPKDLRLPPAEWKRRKQVEFEAAPLQTLDQVLATPAGMKHTQAKNFGRRQLKPILAIVGPLLILGGLYLGQQLWRLEQGGVRAPGTVRALERSGSADGDTHHPVVWFTGQDGGDYQFKDKVGSNPPAYRLGADVTVLYRAAAPQQSAMIDHGIWNWLLPVLLSGFGMLAILGALTIFREPRANGDDNAQNGRN